MWYVVIQSAAIVARSSHILSCQHSCGQPRRKSGESMSPFRISASDGTDDVPVQLCPVGDAASSGSSGMGLVEDERRGARARRKGFGLFAACLLISGACGDDETDIDALEPYASVPELETDTFTSAAVCGACHQAIHACWQQSMHSRAFRNNVFQAAYRTATETYSAERAGMCLNCHAPTVRETQDYAAQTAMTHEGVTCDFCHSLRGADLDAPDKGIDLDVGRTKYGPLKRAQSPAHKVKHSDLHRGSELCAVCHEYRNEHGVAILETYSEWKASLYAEEGTQCQDCHMQPVEGRIVALGLTDAAREGVNLHDISGSHDLERVREAVEMKILSVERVSDKKVLARIAVNNVGSGHCFPTGLPKHRAVLEVGLTDRGRLVKQHTIEFAKVLLNDEMIPITLEEEMFLESRSIRNDTRLKPKERRIVPVTFHDIEGPVDQIEASLSYDYSMRVLKSENGREVIEPTQMNFLIASQKRTVPR